MSNAERLSYEFGPYRLLPTERLLLRDGEPVALTPKAFETLVALVERAGRLVKKQELLDEVWPETNVEESNIAQNVFALRRVLGRNEVGAQYIETVPKRGYRFSASVKLFEDSGEQLRMHHYVRAGLSPPGAPKMSAPPQAHPSGHLSSDHPAAPLANTGSGDSRMLQTPQLSLDQPTTVARPETTATPIPQTIGAKTARPEPRRGLRIELLAGTIAIVLSFVGLGFLSAYLLLNPSTSSPAITMRITRLISGTKIWSAAISPDGRHVAHVVVNAGQTSVWVRQVSTTTDLQVSPAQQQAVYWGLTFSRDGDYLYYLKHARGESSPALYRVPSLGGASRNIIAGIDSYVTTSPDSKQIAFIRNAPGESVLMIADADGRNERRLAVRKAPIDFFSGGPRGGPSWSPDGQTIATGVISLTGGYHGEVIIVSVSDGTERTLTRRRWYQVGQVAWLPDGSGLLAVARETAAAQIWHVSYADGAIRKVTNDLNDYHGVSLTADARMLITVQYERSSTIAFVPEKPPTASKRSTAGMNEGFYGLSWTPDGKLVYASEAGGNLDIWLMHQDGVTAEQLTTDSQHDSTASVSPDGRNIAFVSDRNGGIPHIWRMNIDGSDQRQLTNQAFEATPSFTPDGHWVVYGVAGSGIWKIPREGGEPVIISGEYAHTPSVSPDGSLVACTYRDQTPNAVDKIALLPIVGGPPVKVFDEPEGYFSSAIRWTPDASALVYVATHDGASNLWNLPIDGAPPRRVTHFTSDLIFNFAWSRDNSQLALARGTIAEHVVLFGNLKISSVGQ